MQERLFFSVPQFFSLPNGFFLGGGPWEKSKELRKELRLAAKKRKWTPNVTPSLLILRSNSVNDVYAGLSPAIPSFTAWGVAHSASKSLVFKAAHWMGPSQRQVMGSLKH